MTTAGAGCCTACGGSGADASSPETGGLCWDCYGTGHTHDPEVSEFCEDTRAAS